MKRGVLHLVDSSGFYGAEAVILNLCIGLNESDVNPVIGCFIKESEGKTDLGVMAEKKGISVKYVILKNKFDLGAVKQIHDIVIEENIMLLHSHGYKPSFFCLLLHVLYGVPYVITCHLWTKETLRYRFYILLDRISMLFAQKVIAVSHPIANDIKRWRLNRGNVAVINNGIDIDKYAETRNDFNPQRLRDELGLQKDTRLVGTVGRLTHQKAQHYFIEAARKIVNVRSDVEFIIVGEGHRRDYLKGLIEKLDLSDKVHLLGFRADAINIMKLLDVFVLSSIDEGLPIVLLEAMSLGLPIVSTDVGEIPRVIQDGFNGFLIRKEDVIVLSEAILRFLKDKYLSEAMGRSAAETAISKYSLSNMTTEYMNIYNSIST